MSEHGSSGHRMDDPEVTGDGPTHLDLLEQARTLQDAAFTHDVSAVHDQLARLREAIEDHLDGEDDAFDDLSHAAADVVRSGQGHLMSEIDDLLGVAADDHPDCHCVEGTSRVTSLLRRQARLETGIRS